VGIWFRSGHPEISQRNKLFSKIAAGGDFVGEAAGQYPAEIAPAPGDPFILKKRTSAFAGSDLQILLGSMEIDTLVLAGIATSGVVLSTVRAAADLDYRLIVLSDACADADSEVHRVLLEKVFPKQAEVMTVSEWETGLPPAGERELSH
jgi:nicotinamidase-related amidase